MEISEIAEAFKKKKKNNAQTCEPNTLTVKIMLTDVTHKILIQQQRPNTTEAIIKHRNKDTAKRKKERRGGGGKVG